MAYNNLLQTVNLLQTPNLLEVLGSSGFSNELQIANALEPNGGGPGSYGIELESGSGVITLEDGSSILLEIQ